MGKSLNESNQIKSNFGAKGWLIIIYVGILFYFMTFMTVSGLNIFVPSLSEFHGLDYNSILAMSTPAGVIALIVCMFFGRLVSEKGAAFTATLCLLLGGVCTIWYGNASTLVQYAISITLMVSFINGFSNIAGNALIANWFPKKKGLALGWSTMGMNLASATLPLFISLVATIGGINKAISLMGIIMIVLSVITKIFLKSIPEEAGCTPDNLPVSHNLSIDEVKEKSIQKPEMKWTYSKLFKSKEIWLMGIAYGINGLVTVGIMSQLVPRMVERGYAQSTATIMVSITAIIGVFGSYAWGVVDQKWGTKKASVLFGVWFIITIAFSLIDNTVCLYIFIIMLGAAIGGNANFPPSMTTTIFGRNEFPIAFPVVNTILGVIRSLAFAILAIALSITGSFTGAYIILAILQVIGIIAIIALDDTPKVVED